VYYLEVNVINFSFYTFR